MNLTRHDSIASFLAAAGPLLEVREAENHLLLGLCGDIAQSTAAEVSPALLTVSEGQQVVAAALRAPLRKLILTAGPPAAIEVLATHAAQHKVDLPGVHGPGDSATHFAEHFARITGRVPVAEATQRMFQCHQALRPQGTAGKLRRATADDTPLLAEWITAFTHEVNHAEENPLPIIQRKLRRDEIFLWDDNGPVCTASIAGQGGRLVRVMLVYTPPAQRGRGYAAACVSALTERVLDAGLACFLYTDAANPISNHVYAKIGYEYICDFGNWRFE